MTSGQDFRAIYLKLQLTKDLAKKITNTDFPGNLPKSNTAILRN